MYHIALWINIFTFAKVICVILASTHWIVTDEGFIQPILDSPFHLKVPNDLLAFLEQENRLSEIHEIYQHLLERKILLEHSSLFSLSEAQHIQKKYNTNDNCIKVKNKNIGDLDLSLTITSDGSDRNGIGRKDFFSREFTQRFEPSDVPVCDSLPFSMHTFDHLQGMKQRHNLSIPLDPALRDWLLPNIDIRKFGHLLSYALLANSTSWLHYNLASVFWRINANASKALECSRNAVYLAPREYKDVALHNMGAVFYQAQKFPDAAVIFHAAVDHAPYAAINHFILGNTYAHLAEFEKSAACYKNAKQLRPHSEREFSLSLNMMMCYAFRVMEILDIHNAIQEMRNAFEEYTMFNKWQVTGIKALNIQSPLSAKILDNPNIMLSNAENIPKNPLMSTMADKKIFKYSLLQNHDMFSNGLFGMLQASTNLYKTVDSFQNQINEITDNYELSDKLLLVKRNRYDLPAVLENLPKNMPSGIKDITNDDPFIVVSLLKTYLDSYKDSVNLNSNTISNNDEEYFENIKIKYPKDKMKISRMKYEFDKNSEWPSMEECEGWTDDNSKLTDLNGNIKIFPVYLPIDNKGFNVPKILSDYIRIDMKTEHPLPWHPPTCPTKSLTNVNYLPEGLKVKAKLLPQFADDEHILKDTLIFNIYGSLDTAIHFQEAEIGHRIYTAMKMKVAPKWVLYTMASLYWRVRRNVPNTLDCLICAMEEIPKDMKDVALTSLASILYELGYDDSAFKLANEAHYINMYEPATNFLLSLIHKKNNHMLGQMYHMKQVVRVNENFMFGKAYQLLKLWSCHNKFSMKFQEESSISDGEKSEGTHVHVLSKEGVILSMTCTTICDGQSCHPSNVFVYETANEGRVVREDGVIPLMVTEEKSLTNVYTSTVDLFTKSAFRINLMFEDTLFKIAVPLMQLTESTVETKDGKILFKNDVTSSDHFVIDKNGYQKDLGKFSLLVPPHPDWSGKILEWVINDKQILLHSNKEECSKLKFIDDLISSKQIWNMFQERFTTINQIITPFETSDSQKPSCAVSNSLTPDSDMLAWYFIKLKRTHSSASTEKILKLLRKLMGGTTASIDKIGAMIAEAMRHHEESWILRVLAGIYYAVKGNSQTAITCMKQALTLAPEHDKDVPLLGLAALSYWVNSIHEAIVYSKFAYEIHPNFAAGPFFIGFILAFTNRETEAFIMLQKAYIIDNDLTIIEDVIKHIVCTQPGNEFENIFAQKTT